MTRISAWAAAVLACVFTSAARGAMVLDQSGTSTNLTAGWAIGNQWNPMAETFTAGMDGLLAQVGVQIYKNAGAGGDVYLQIFPTQDGAPVWNSPLVQAFIPNATVPVSAGGVMTIPVTLVDVSSAGITVSAGQVYAIGLYRQAYQTGIPPWMIWVGGTYSDGNLYVKTPGVVSRPSGFQTYVTPAPLPAAMWGGMGLLGVLGAASVRRRVSR